MTKDAVAGRIRRLLAMADKRATELGIPDTESAVTADMLVQYADAGGPGRVGSGPVGARYSGAAHSMRRPRTAIAAHSDGAGRHQRVRPHRSQLLPGGRRKRRRTSRPWR